MIGQVLVMVELGHVRFGQGQDRIGSGQIWVGTGQGRTGSLPFICVGDFIGRSCFGLSDASLLGSLGPILSWANCFFGFKTVYFVLSFSKSAASACFGGPNVTFYFITIYSDREFQQNIMVP